MVNPDYAPLKDIRQMIDAVHEASVEIGECGRLMMSGQCADMPREMEYEMLEALAHLCSRAGLLASYYLEGFCEIEREKRLKRLARVSPSGTLQSRRSPE